MPRDSIKDKAYFDENIDFSIESIEEDIDDVANDRSLSVDSKMQFCFGIVQDIIDLAHQLYSRGDKLEVIKSHLDTLLVYRQKQKSFADELPLEEQKERMGWEEIREDYMRNIFLKWLSFSYCLDMGQAYYQEVLDLIGNQGRDALFDNIAVKLGDSEREVAESVLFKRRFNKLYKVIESEPAQRPQLMLAYLEAWYKLEGSPDYHLMDTDAYDGYWCWEAALVTKLYEIDDSLYIEHQYYPKDLVHWSEQ